MPRFDGTGPQGQGAGTGRGMGPCVSGSGIRQNVPGYGFGRGRFNSPKNELTALEEEKENISKQLEVIKEEIKSLKTDK